MKVTVIWSRPFGDDGEWHAMSVTSRDDDHEGILTRMRQSSTPRGLEVRSMMYDIASPHDMTKPLVDMTPQLSEPLKTALERESRNAAVERRVTLLEARVEGVDNREHRTSQRLFELAAKRLEHPGVGYDCRAAYELTKQHAETQKAALSELEKRVQTNRLMLVRTMERVDALEASFPESQAKVEFVNADGRINKGEVTDD